MDLAAQNVEQIRRGSHVNDLHVDVLVLAFELVLGGEDARLLVAELQPALHSSGRVLRSLSVVTVRQRQYKTRALQPLGLTGSDELVDNTLRVVGEVTKLRFPHHKSIGRGQGVSVFETKAVKN